MAQNDVAEIEAGGDVLIGFQWYVIIINRNCFVSSYIWSIRAYQELFTDKFLVRRNASRQTSKRLFIKVAVSIPQMYNYRERQNDF